MFYGKFRGTVANNIDPQQLGRVQIQVPSVLGDSRLSWAMPCAPYAGPGVGFFAVPPVGARIWVEFENGDPDFPIWVGGFWDQSSDIPASPAIAEKKVFKTDTATLTLDDTPGAGGITIETTAGMKIVLNAQGIEIDDGQGATVKLQGPKTSINGTALEVT
ncbi:MAG: phage baseplate assembly protein V [Pseudomonadota bacterium]|nr:phage baseplate assembly protein V [Pseudomonadota bacterium]